MSTTLRALSIAGLLISTTYVHNVYATGTTAQNTCSALGETLGMARANYRDSCRLPRRDCDLTESGWLCASYLIESNPIAVVGDIVPPVQGVDAPMQDTETPANGVETTTDLSCVDSDGDGWGWDGTASCIVADFVNVVGACIDTDGDGWGWDGEKSCLVVEQAASDPVEDTSTSEEILIPVAIPTEEEIATPEEIPTTPMDSAAPLVSITGPSSGSTQTETLINIFGTATDDNSVEEVELAVRRVNTNEFWNGSSWQSASVRVLASISDSGDTSVNWVYPLSVNKGTRVEITAFATDAAGNVSSPVTANTAVTAKVMALGDSITEGVLGQQSYRKPLTADFSLSGCVAEMVGSRSQNRIPTSFVSPHEGYSGHGVEFFLPQSVRDGNPGINTIMNANPDIVLIHLGSNDMDRDQSIESTILELQELVVGIWNNNPDTEVHVANVIPWFGDSSNLNIGSDVDALGDEIQSWIAGNGDPRLHLVDVRSGYRTDFMITDGIHPGSDGEEHIADAFLASLADNGICP